MQRELSQTSTSSRHSTQSRYNKSRLSNAGNVSTKRKASQRKSKASVGTRSQFSTRSSHYFSKRDVGGSKKYPESQGAQLKVLDEDGNDVTPVSLLSLKPTVLKQHHASLVSANMKMEKSPSSEFSEVFEALSSAGGFTRSILGSVASSASALSDEMSTSRYREELEKEEEKERGVSEDASLSVALETAPQEITEAELDRFIHLTLEETETVWLLDIPSTCIATDSLEFQTVSERNSTYMDLKKKRVGNENYVERGMQTFNNALKTKDCQITMSAVREYGTQANVWDIYDTYEQKPSADAGEGVGPLERVGLPEKGVNASMISVSASDSTVGQGPTRSSATQLMGGVSSLHTGSRPLMSMTTTTTMTRPSTALSTISGVGTTSVDGSLADITSVMRGSDQVSEAAAAAAQLASLPNIFTQLQRMERVIAQNNYHDKHIVYRLSPTASGAVRMEKAVSLNEDTATPMISSVTTGIARGMKEASAPASLQFLWNFYCDFVEGRAVTCVAWNPDIPDMLAVGYGQLEFSECGLDGRVLIWSLKNTEYPERVIETARSVTALEFCPTHTNILAVGLYSGALALYDLRKSGVLKLEPLLQSGLDRGAGDGCGTHTDPVWAVHWQGGEDERGDAIITASTDGRVIQWRLNKGLEHSDIMKLKRVSKSAKGEGGGDMMTVNENAFISRRAGALAMAFAAEDPAVYFIGTEDGTVHKCSVAYNEQYLGTYLGHRGAVYSVALSPYSDDVFLTASADWSARLWNSHSPHPTHIFQPYNSQVNDVVWAPSHPTVFALASANGKVSVYDLAYSAIDPVFTTTVEGAVLTSLSFCPAFSLLLVGDSRGFVNVYHLTVSTAPPTTPAEGRALLEALLADKGSLPTELGA